MIIDETAANDAVEDALKTLQRAKELCERAGYGSLVLDSLEDACLSTQYVLDTVSEKN